MKAANGFFTFVLNPPHPQLQPNTCLSNRDMNLPVIAYIDGGSRGNPGPAGYGVSIETSEGAVINELTGAIGVATKNNAESRTHCCARISG